MLHLNRESPYLNLKLDDINKYPLLPSNFQKIIIPEFIIYNFLLINSEEYIEKTLCHICWQDDLVSIEIMRIVNAFLKINFYPYPLMENVFFTAIKIFNLEDTYTHRRLETLFELEEDHEKTLHKFYFANKDKNYILVIQGLYILAKAIEKYENVFEYFKKNKNKLKWVNEYYTEFFEDKFNLSYVKNIHSDILSVIEAQIIIKLDI